MPEALLKLPTLDTKIAYGSRHCENSMLDIDGSVHCEIERQHIGSDTMTVSLLGKLNQGQSHDIILKCNCRLIWDADT